MGYQKLLPKEFNGTNRNQTKQPMKQTFECPIGFEIESAVIDGNKVTCGLKQMTFKSGDILTWKGYIFIAKSDFDIRDGKIPILCHIKKISYQVPGRDYPFDLNSFYTYYEYKLTIEDTFTGLDSSDAIIAANNPERKLLFDIIDKNGYEYNSGTNNIDKKPMYKPTKGETYYTPCSEGAGCWCNAAIENNWHSLGLIFKTKEESDSAAEKIRQIFAK